MDKNNATKREMDAWKHGILRNEGCMVPLNVVNCVFFCEADFFRQGP